MNFLRSLISKRFLVWLFSTLLLLVVVLEWVGVSLSNETLYSSCQNRTPLYGSREPYCLLIVRERQVLSDHMYMRVMSQEIFKSDQNYFFELSYLDDAYDEHTDRVALEHAETLWNEDGISFTVPLPRPSQDGYDLSNKYQILVPKESFIGGR